MRGAISVWAPAPRQEPPGGWWSACEGLVDGPLPKAGPEAVPAGAPRAGVGRIHRRRRVSCRSTGEASRTTARMQRPNARGTVSPRRILCYDPPPWALCEEPRGDNTGRSWH